MQLQTRSIALEVRPSHKEKLVALIAGMRGGRSAGREGEPGYYPELLEQLPTCHFLSICVVESDDYDPLFVIEANYDGASGAFWGDLRDLMGEDLRQALRCCKRPLDRTAPLYDAITATHSTRDSAPFLEAHVMRPRAFFHGNRGMTRERILAEAALAEDIQKRLGNGTGEWDGRTSEDVRQTLRCELLETYPWLAERPERRIPLSETIMDWAKLASALFAVALFCLVPGVVLAALIGDMRLAILLAIVAVPLWLFLRKYRQPSDGVGTKASKPLLSVIISNAIKVLIGLTTVFLLSWPIIALLNVLAGQTVWATAWHDAARQIAWGIAWLTAVLVPGALIWLRYLERHDSSQVDPPIDEALLRQMVELEDWIPQNHMVSVVSHRPQIFRRLFAYVGTLLIHLGLRAAIHDGYLGSMRTIHAAQWTFVNNGSRMLFLSNYDFSWEAYFDDFIEKAHEGVTAVWGGSVGFPPTSMLIEDGAAYGRAFKRWARHSMSPTRFWVSAYPTLTVDQIERNNRIANGLRAHKLSPEAASQWVRDL